MNKIQIENNHLIIVKEIQNKQSVLAYVFGSTSKNTAKKLSDLDLCIKQDLDKSTVRKLRQEFEESNLPFKVDIVLW